MNTLLMLRILKLLWGQVLKANNPWDMPGRWEFEWAKNNGMAAKWADWDQRRAELTRRMYPIIFKDIVPEELRVEILVIEALDFLNVEK